MNAKGLMCLVTALSLFAAPAAQPQSLADLAKKEKERQAKAKAAGGPAKTYSDDGKSRPDEEKATSGDNAASTRPPSGAGTGSSQRPTTPRPSAEGGRPDPRSFRATRSPVLSDSQHHGVCHRVVPILSKGTGVSGGAAESQRGHPRHRGGQSAARREPQEERRRQGHPCDRCRGKDHRGLQCLVD
jgi:hypothetical protein